VTGCGFWVVNKTKKKYFFGLVVCNVAFDMYPNEGCEWFFYFMFGLCLGFFFTIQGLPRYRDPNREAGASRTENGEM
jgi:hypothetical protein